MADMSDPMVELEAEMKKIREAKAAEARLKAQKQALFDMTAQGAEDLQQSQGNTAFGSSSNSPVVINNKNTAASSSGPSRVAIPRQISSENSAVYIPPHWNTAGQEPDLSTQNPRAELTPGTIIENESISLAMCGCGAPGGGAGTQFFAMAGLHPPSDASFEEWFRGWFEREHFPTMSEDLKRELVQRAKTKGFFSGLSSQVKKWAMANTDERLQSDVWFAYFRDNAPPRFKVFGCVKMASVNLGSQVAPCWLSFLGIPESETQRLSGGGAGIEDAKWFLPPFCGGTADIGALLDELDGRGGMAALLASAA